MGLFQSGENWTGNRKGRPKAGQGLSELARAKTRDGKEIVQYYWSVFVDKSLDHSLRLEAAKRLEDRGWGRAAQTIEHRGSIEIHDYREQFDRIMKDDTLKAHALAIAEAMSGEEKPGPNESLH